ncbi:hypothetical protein M407DRAFT_27044 [Tulasnella calospora MUT 4182]|uniref:F-box domain-containing protein n=1 Tax=Tulasnella calospora MUT 4182 TaxID=1051891 RepID=A0A0C3KQ59_9AGAM|nr:hypothetical protein M407DRAFT_27044 [Tulasnella calospora MUT 4182]
MEAPDNNHMIDHRKQTKRHPARAQVPKRKASPGPRCHIDNLPAEVLVMVFSFILLEDPYTIPKPQRTSLLLVCKFWTQVVTESHFFWTAIDWSSTELKQEWDHSLSLSKGFPFAIECRGDDSHPRNAHKVKALLDWAIIKSVRIRKFRFMFRTSTEMWTLVWQALTQANLDLEEIELLSILGNMWYQPKQDRTFLGTHAPKLQSLTLNSVTVPWALCAIPTLRELSISFHYILSSWADGSDILPTPVDIISIMASTPVLETLHLGGIDKHRAQQSPALPIVSPRQLKELNVEGMPNGALCSLAESLDLPQTARVSFTIVEPPWPQAGFNEETDFAQLVSLLAGYGFLQDCHLKLEETSLLVSNLRCEIKLSKGGHIIDYKRAFRGLSAQAGSQVVSASISSMYSDSSREPLEAIHDTFPDVRLLRFPVYRLGDGFGDWPGVLEDPGRAARGDLPESLCPKLTALEVDIDVMDCLDLSGVLSFIRARNSPNRPEGDQRNPHPILRLRITAPSKRIPAPQRSIWKEIKALVMSCRFEATTWEYEEEETEKGDEDKMKPYESSDLEE